MKTKQHTKQLKWASNKTNVFDIYLIIHLAVIMKFLNCEYFFIYGLQIFIFWKNVKDLLTSYESVCAPLLVIYITVYYLQNHLLLTYVVRLCFSEGNDLLFLYTIIISNLLFCLFHVLVLLLCVCYSSLVSFRHFNYIQTVLFLL